MFHEDILYISYCKYINLIFDQLNLDNFSQYLYFLHRQIPDFQIF